MRMLRVLFPPIKFCASSSVLGSITSKMVNNNRTFPWYIKLAQKRHFSVRPPSIYEQVSSVEEVTAFMAEQVMEVPKLKDLPPTTEQLLLECDNLEELLLFTGDMIRCKKLQDQDLLTCIKLITAQSRKQNQPKTMETNILNNSNFLLLLGKLIIASERLPTPSLSRIFDCLRKLNVPDNSNTMKIFVKIMQNRINDFFPNDAVIVMKNTFLSKNIDFRILHEAMKMHIRNMATDEVFFQSCLVQMRIENLTFLLRLSNAFSTFVQKHLMHACQEVIIKMNRPLRFHEALWIVKALGNICVDHKFLLKAATKQLYSDQYSITSEQRIAIDQAMERIHSTNNALPFEPTKFLT